MFNKKRGLITLLVGLAAGNIIAGDFSSLTSYTTGDVLLCFRKGGNDMVVDAGPISTYTNLTANQRYTITAYTGTQLSMVGTNSTSWSAFTSLSDNSLFMTKARASLNTQTTPWLDQSGPSQQAVANRIATIPPGAYDELTYDSSSYPYSSTVAVGEADVSSDNPNYPDGESYHDALDGGYGSDFDGFFQGNPENTTSSTFTKSSTVVRSDFYQLTPTGGYAHATLIGYFELNTNGVMTYVAYPSAVPTMSLVSRSGTSVTINYTTGLYGTYTLRATNSLTAGPMITWPAISVLTSGDTATHSTTFTDINPVEFYTITAQ